MTRPVAERDRPHNYICFECGFMGLPASKSYSELTPDQVFAADLYSRRIGSLPVYVGNQTLFLTKKTPLETFEMCKATMKAGLPTCPKCPDLVIPFSTLLIKELGHKSFLEYALRFGGPEGVDKLMTLPGVSGDPLEVITRAAIIGRIDTLKAYLDSGKINPRFLGRLLETFALRAAMETDPELIRLHDETFHHIIIERETEWKHLTADALHRMERAFLDHPLQKKIVKEIFNREFGIE